MVLHPTLSRYARVYDNFDAFKRGEPLIDNGYISDSISSNPDRRLILHPTASSFAQNIRLCGINAPPPSPVTSTSSVSFSDSLTDDSDVEMIDLTLEEDVEMVYFTEA